MSEAGEVDGSAVISGGEAAEVLEAIEASFDTIAMPIGLSVVGDGDLPCPVGWDHRLGLHDRRPASGGGLVHHSDRGSQYVSIKYTGRLADAGIEPSVGTVGDSCDNALAETVNGLYKTEVIWQRGSWKSFEQVEYATLEWVDWFNHRRLLEPIRNISPAEAEARSAVRGAILPAMVPGNR